MGAMLYWVGELGAMAFGFHYLFVPSIYGTALSHRCVDDDFLSPCRYIAHSFVFFRDRRTLWSINLA